MTTLIAPEARVLHYTPTYYRSASSPVKKDKANDLFTKSNPAIYVTRIHRVLRRKAQQTNAVAEPSHARPIETRGHPRQWRQPTRTFSDLTSSVTRPPH
ncbi:hypothetical protein COCC4DRAFT_34537 [Bipolaris maydis ATCC 48331]|uniref:Uncharacterized protein n=2 Tax=Cochliobolus heterostrophus TaxID=5016 RepID=M2TBV3_COCH5|nr:uncharacterized protein COCC4DRAFT_34537 [Bipolaris maydis ATCC 48331]EMD95040.1 hypothetical protein COCHEDRAFT_1019911 [Bipolaris maydis C5]ENI00056.1 hypothetical protein COCC4DRAFT_34537 [Bipolaris maydis ATCC 48331]